MTHGPMRHSVLAEKREQMRHQTSGAGRSVHSSLAQSTQSFVSLKRRGPAGGRAPAAPQCWVCSTCGRLCTTCQLPSAVRTPSMSCGAWRGAGRVQGSAGQQTEAGSRSAASRSERRRAATARLARATRPLQHPAEPHPPGARRRKRPPRRRPAPRARPAAAGAGLSRRAAARRHTPRHGAPGLNLRGERRGGCQVASRQDHRAQARRQTSSPAAATTHRAQPTTHPPGKGTESYRPAPANASRSSPVGRVAGGRQWFGAVELEPCSRSARRSMSVARCSWPRPPPACAPACPTSPPEAATHRWSRSAR